MTRWWWMVLMAPVMWGLQQLVRWADRLHAWQYSENAPPPGPADFTRAAVVFGASLLVPLLASGFAAFLAFRRKAPAGWPIVESGIILLPYLALAAGMAGGVAGIGKGPVQAGALLTGTVWFILEWASVLVGGAIAAAGHHAGACVVHRTWGQLAVSLLGIGAGTLYLFWLSGFILYVNT